MIPLPENIDIESAGPLLCGGITVFKPLLMHHITATSRVGVIGIGGLGHIAIKLLHAMGCEVTAFSSNPAKEQEVLAMGADKVVNSRDPQALKALAGQFDLIINTVNVSLDWQPYFEALTYGGNFHTVGAVLTPLSVPAFTLIAGDRSVSGSATGTPYELRKLMRFAARSKVAPTTELFPMSKINDAIQHVRDGKALPRGVESRFLKIIRSADLRRCPLSHIFCLSYRQHSLPTLFGDIGNIMVDINAHNILFICLWTLQRLKLTFSNATGIKCPARRCIRARIVS